MKRKKFTANFKTRVVLEVIKEQETIRALSQKYQLARQQIKLWKRGLLSNAQRIFQAQPRKKSLAQECEERLLKTVGQLKLENDFLKKALS